MGGEPSKIGWDEMLANAEGKPPKAVSEYELRFIHKGMELAGSAAAGMDCVAQLQAEAMQASLGVKALLGAGGVAAILTVDMARQAPSDAMVVANAVMKNLDERDARKYKERYESLYRQVHISAPAISNPEERIQTLIRSHEELTVRLLPEIRAALDKGTYEPADMRLFMTYPMVAALQLICMSKLLDDGYWSNTTAIRSEAQASMDFFNSHWQTYWDTRYEFGDEKEWGTSDRNDDYEMVTDKVFNTTYNLGKLRMGYNYAESKYEIPPSMANVPTVPMMKDQLSIDCRSWWNSISVWCR